MQHAGKQTVPAQHALKSWRGETVAHLPNSLQLGIKKSAKCISILPSVGSVPWPRVQCRCRLGVTSSGGGVSATRGRVASVRMAKTRLASLVPRPYWSLVRLWLQDVRPDAPPDATRLHWGCTRARGSRLVTCTYTRTRHIPGHSHLSVLIVIKISATAALQFVINCCV